jgi:hypothetical protein
MKKGVIALFVVIIIFTFLHIVVFHRYSWQEMDWNCDGKITLDEIFSSSDIGKKTILINGNTCTEYFSFKDGLTVKINCPHSN